MKSGASMLSTDYKFRRYQKQLINIFITKSSVSLKDKTILEIGSDFNLNVARYFISQGAKEVVCVNPKFPETLKSPDKRIRLIKDFGEQTQLPDGYFDIIFGIALLEHVLHVTELVKEVKRMLKFTGVAFLQGCPLYTSKAGHHLWVQRQDICYKFSDDTNPFENWEHLCCESEEELTQCLKNKNIPEEHIRYILNYLLSDDTSKFTANKILSLVKQVKGLSIESFIGYDTTKPNQYYYCALEKYSKQDLRAKEIRIYIEHRLYNILSKPVKILKKFLKGLILSVKIYFY